MEPPFVQPLVNATPDAKASPQARARLGAAAVSPETLHPSLWRGHQLGRGVEQGVPSGFPALDAQLPGGGWPRRALTELLLPHPGVGEVRLLAQALARVQQAGRLVMMFDPPAAVSAPALQQLGLEVDQLLVIQTHAQVRPEADRLWALEQVLKSGHVGAVIAWLPPRLRAERVRRLQLAAHAHDGPAFMLREASAQQQASAAPLRLALRAAGADQLALRLLKRRGPPLLAPLHLALPPVLSAAAWRRLQGLAEAEAAAGERLRAASFVNLA